MSKKYVIFAIVIYIVFPLSSVFMKLASQNNDLLIKFFFFFLSIATLGIFSILWQKLLNKVDLIRAYLFKSTTIIWSVVYGISIFGERISLNEILGMVIAMIGLWISLRTSKGESNE
jgi:drug/metabolite transporter (DMT)-like permease